ncbi:ionotropic receptor 76b [Glossina fuscipes fuscipes]
MKMKGIELMLAALCLSCDFNADDYPNGVLVMDEIYFTNGSDAEDGKVLTKAKEIVSSDKEVQLEKLRNWINGRELQIATLEDYPLSYTEVLGNGTRVGSGVAFELIDFLKEKFNFTYKVVVPGFNIIGGTVDYTNSLIELLNGSQVHMAAAFLPLLSDQRGYIFYSTVILDEGEWIMVMQRPHESASGSGLLAPFDYRVWTLILVSFLAVGPIIYILIILRNRLTGDTEQKPYSLGHYVWFVYGALLKQGSVLSPIADSTRLLFATWWIFITILTSFYTANLTAFLTLSQFTLPFNTVDDILYKNKYFVTVRGGGVEYAIKTVNESLYMLHYMAENDRAVFSLDINDTTNLRTYVEEQGFVLIRDRPAITHTLYTDYRQRRATSMNDEKVHCPFAQAKHPILKKKRSFAYPIGSNLSHLFDRELLNLVESGIIKYLAVKNLPNAEICPQNLGSTERQLRNGDLIMTYYITMVGFIVSLVIFISELLFRCINQLWTRNNVNDAVAKQKASVSKGYNQGLILTMKATPPPPYQSIFTGGIERNAGNKWKHVFGSKTRQLSREYPGFISTTGLTTGSHGIRRIINGREYMMYQAPNGETQLIPVRAPSATLFQYTYVD